MNNPQEKPNKPEDRIATAWSELWLGTKSWFIDLIDLKQGMDREGTVISIKSGKMMRGANAWMLVCSIMIASLGLDLDSSAVIIGAMLISPLMSPILGIGLGVGTNDKETLYVAIKQFSISIIIALITSTLYFKLTPLGSFTDMISARTAPTLLDGFVAIFGGFAGIISITRKDKSNAIPGVAIATALMPPLCVTGYGLATGDMQIARNSFYLFFLNSFFIAVTSYIIIRVLKFPLKEHTNPKDGFRAKLAIGIISLLLIIPSISILKDVIEKMRYEQAVKSFVDRKFKTDCISHRVFENKDSSKLLVVQLINRDISDSLITSYNEELDTTDYLETTSLQAIPDYRFQLDELDKKTLEFNRINVIAKHLETLQKKQAKEERRDSIENAIVRQSQQLDSLQWVRLCSSLQRAQQFNILDTISFGKNSIMDFNHPSKNVHQFLAHWSNRPGPVTKRRQEKQLRVFLGNYFQDYDIQIDTFVVHSYD